MLFTPQANAKLRAQFPLDASDPNEQRIKLDVALDQLRRLERRPGSRIEVTDIPSGRRFLVEAADCGAACYCAARVVRELPAT